MKMITKIVVGIFVALIMFTGCSTNDSATNDSAEATPYKIIVDEDTLIQYIQWNTDREFALDSRIGGMTVRLKEDGTPYTIDREDLDKYEHFSFGK